MENDKRLRQSVDSTIVDRVKAELNELDHELIELNGKKLRPANVITSTYILCMCFLIQIALKT